MYTLRRYCVPLMFGFVSPMLGTFFTEFDWYFELLDTGLLPKFFVLRLFIDWF